MKLSEECRTWLQNADGIGDNMENSRALEERRCTDSSDLHARSNVDVAPRSLCRDLERVNR